MGLDYIRLVSAAEVPSWLQVFASFSCFSSMVGDLGARGMHFRTVDAAVERSMAIAPGAQTHT